MEKKNPLLVILGVSAVFFVVFLAVAIGVVTNLTGGGGGRAQKKLFSQSNNIGVIEVKGAILDSKKLLEQISSFEDDGLIRAVLVQINSPGGAVAPSQEIYEALRRLSKKKPVYSSMSSLAASGGYYVACGTKKIYANPGTLTGSIGVIMQFADFSKLLQWAKVNPYNVKTGRYKDIGNVSREMTAEEKNLLQELIDNVLGQFRRAVAAARGLPMEKVIELSDGRIFSGEQAKNVRLVDELGGIEDAVEALAKEAGINGKPHLVYANKRRSPFERLLGDFEDESESGSSSSVGLADGVRTLVGLLTKKSGRGMGSLGSVQSGLMFLFPYAGE